MKTAFFLKYGARKDFPNIISFFATQKYLSLGRRRETGKLEVDIRENFEVGPFRLFAPPIHCRRRRATLLYYSAPVRPQGGGGCNSTAWMNVLHTVYVA